MSRALRFQSGLPLHYWGDCVLCAVHIINRLPTVALKFKTPCETLYNELPLYDHLKTFGCLALASNPSRTMDKFSPKGIPCVFLGYPSSQKGYKLLNLFTNKLFVSRDVTFHEHIFPFKIFPTSTPTSSPAVSVNPLPLHADPPPLISPAEPPNPTSFPSSASAPRRSSRQVQPPSWHKDYLLVGLTNMDSPTKVISSTDTQVTPSFSCFMSQSLQSKDPIHFKDAITSPLWTTAMNEELESLEANNTWQLTVLPKNKRAIGCKWVYRTKFNVDGTLDEYKARLVILGNHQRPGEDYEQTFAPVAKMVTMRSLLAIATLKHWCVHQMDVKNAFLHGDLNETVYMRLPPGYTRDGTHTHVSAQGEAHRLNSPLVCKLNKSLYGLKQAPRQWFAKLSTSLIHDGFIQSKSDYTLFIKNVSDRAVSYIFGPQCNI